MPVVAALPFPGRAVKLGDARPELVLLIQRRLNAAGCGPVSEDGAFARPMQRAVKLFQMRFTDADGLPLKVDGIVGPITWTALVGGEQPVPPASLPLAAAVLSVAEGEISVRERPPGTNRGPRVDEYLRGVGLNPAGGSFAWCAAFVHFCFGEAAIRLGRRNPAVRTAGVLAHWNKAESQGARRIRTAEASSEPQLVRPGQVFIIDYGRGAGHTGIVTGMRSGKLLTIEGNTNDGGSREGVGVFARHGRTIGSINKGFIEYE
jgi:peptidoglycan hydrolase-like protein with peptidoglycan-binding domain